MAPLSARSSLACIRAMRFDLQLEPDMHLHSILLINEGSDAGPSRAATTEAERRAARGQFAPARRGARDRGIPQLHRGRGASRNLAAGVDARHQATRADVRVAVV